MALLKDDAVSGPNRRPSICLVAAVALLFPAFTALAQPAPHSGEYGRANTFGVFIAYSNDSSHMLLGYAENRKLLNIGASYNRRILMNRIVNWQYSAEIMPVALESDPLTNVLIQETSPKVVSVLFTNQEPQVTCNLIVTRQSYQIMGTTYAQTNSSYCHGREWTIGEAMSPIGFQWNFLTRRRIEPYLVGHGGYMYSTHPIPIQIAGSFNFTFDIGAGIELYRTRRQSLRLEYRYHHLSNHFTATYNPGVDSGLLQLTYCFGR